MRMRYRSASGLFGGFWIFIRRWLLRFANWAGCSFRAAMKTLLSLLLTILVSVLSAEPAAVKDVTPDEAEALLKGAAKPLILDVRTADEFAQGRIPGAKNVDFFGDDFEKQVAALKGGGPVIVHCAAGGRSAQSLPKITALKKFGVIYHLKAGFNGWKSAGKPVETKPVK